MTTDDYFEGLLQDPEFLNYLKEKKIKDRFQMEKEFESMLDSRITEGDVINVEENIETRITNK